MTHNYEEIFFEQMAEKDQDKWLLYYRTIPPLPGNSRQVARIWDYELHLLNLDDYTVEIIPRKMPVFRRIEK
jgi:hypothetical protein